VAEQHVEDPNATPAPPALELSAVTKEFVDGEVVSKILHGIDLRIERGEFVALVGPSGSGKSTLLNLIGLLDRATSGKIRLAGVRDHRARRCRPDRAAETASLGFVFQFHHLISALTGGGECPRSLGPLGRLDDRCAPPPRRSSS
jgi:ABC-type lipoprotein export system ATPase subunit